MVKLLLFKNKLKTFAKEAQERGIIFDVGHGGGSFSFRQAVHAIEQGVAPNTISTDLHIGSMNAGMKNQLNVMSKFLNLGLSMEAVVEASGWKAAQVINREKLGHLSEGAVADVAVLDINEGDFGFVDSYGYRMDGNHKLACELTIREGNIVWDLNGISRPAWDKNN